MALLIWVVVEIAIIGYSNEPPLQAIYLVVGVGVALGVAGGTGLAFPHRSPKEV